MKTTVLFAVLVLGGCASTPAAISAPSALVACGSDRWQAMGRSLEQWCATATTTHEQRICATFSPTWSTCPADIRAASRLRDHWINDETIVMRNLGGEWLGVVFRETDGAWTVVGTDGGDIP